MYYVRIIHLKHVYSVVQKWDTKFHNFIKY